VLDISSTPGATEIEIDGAFVGNTAASIEVSPGDHIVRITKQGFAPWERKIKAMPGHASVSPELQPTGNTKPQ
jgi:PEGA domain